MTNLCQVKLRLLNYFYNYENINYFILLLLLTNCAGGNMAKVKIGKRCTVADASQLQESSYVWVVSKEAQKDFDKRINKSNCLDS